MGVSLSGGQKSRISLARAIYRKNAATILIDGTLGTLDVKIAKKVMDNAVLGLCHDKLVIIVTHDLDQAARFDSVIYLREKAQPPKIFNNNEF